MYFRLLFCLFGSKSPCLKIQYVDFKRFDVLAESNRSEFGRISELFRQISTCALLTSKNREFLKRMDIPIIAALNHVFDTYRQLYEAVNKTIVSDRKAA